MQTKKMIYFLNHYSEDLADHFYHIKNLLEELANNNVKIALVIGNSKGIPNFKNKNIEVFILKGNKIYKIFNFMKKVKDLYRNNYKKIFIRIDIKFTLISYLLKKMGLKDLKIYFWQSGQTYHLENNFKYIIKNPYWFIKTKIPFEYIKNRVDYFVTGPELMLDYYNNVVNVKKEKLICLYNDIDISRFKKISTKEKEKLRKELNINIEDEILLYVGNFSPVRKGSYYFPRVVENILKERKNIKLYMIGEGKELQKIKEKIYKKKLQNKIILLGKRSNKEIHKYYQIADIFLALSYIEGMPRVVLEAMASGLPIISTNAGGIENIFCKKQKDFIIDKNNLELIEKKVKILINNKKLQNELSKENIECIKKYSTKNVIKQYIKVLFNS